MIKYFKTFFSVQVSLLYLLQVAIANTDEIIESFGDISIKYNSVFSTAGGTVNRIRGFISWGAYIALTKLAAFAQSRAVSNQRRLYNPVEDLQWTFFAKTLNGFQMLAVFAKLFHRRCTTEF